MSLLYKKESYEIMGACFEVYREMGSGLIEAIYHECLEREFRSRHIPAVHEPKIELEYKSQKLSHHLIPDFIAYSKIIIELKAESHITDRHRAQLQNYLRASGMQLGLLINFGYYPKAQWERIILKKNHPKPQQPPPNLQS